MSTTGKVISTGRFEDPGEWKTTYNHQFKWISYAKPKKDSTQYLKSTYSWSTKPQAQHKHEFLKKSNRGYGYVTGPADLYQFPQDYIDNPIYAYRKKFGITVASANQIPESAKPFLRRSKGIAHRPRNRSVDGGVLRKPCRIRRAVSSSTTQKRSAMAAGIGPVPIVEGETMTACLTREPVGGRNAPRDSDMGVHRPSAERPRASTPPLPSTHPPPAGHYALLTYGQATRQQDHVLNPVHAGFRRQGAAAH